MREYDWSADTLVAVDALLEAGFVRRELNGVDCGRALLPTWNAIQADRRATGGRGTPGGPQWPREGKPLRASWSRRAMLHDAEATTPGWFSPRLGWAAELRQELLNEERAAMLAGQQNWRAWP